MCELTYMLILSTKKVAKSVIAHFLKLSSKRHRLKPFEVSPHDCEQSFAANLRTVIAYDRLFSHPVVEFGLVAFAFLSDNYPHVLIGRFR